MEKDFWIQVLQTALKNNNDLVQRYLALEMKLYLFGSATYNKKPNDIDILICYNTKDMEEAILIKKITTNYLEDVVNMSIDCILMSYKENEQLNFIQKERAIHIFP